MVYFDTVRLSAIDIDDADGGQKGEMETEGFQPRGHCLCGASLIKRLSGPSALWRSITDTSLGGLSEGRVAFFFELLFCNMNAGNKKALMCQNSQNRVYARNMFYNI